MEARASNANTTSGTARFVTVFRLPSRRNPPRFRCLLSPFGRPVPGILATRPMFGASPAVRVLPRALIERWIPADFIRQNDPGQLLEREEGGEVSGEGTTATFGTILWHTYRQWRKHGSDSGIPPA